jgi:GTPase SAR1 family protein
LTASYYRKINFAILVYDVTNSDSFQSLKNWNQDLETNAPFGVVKVIIGNKNESENKVVTDVDLKVRKKNTQPLEICRFNKSGIFCC